MTIDEKRQEVINRAFNLFGSSAAGYAMCFDAGYKSACGEWVRIETRLPENTRVVEVTIYDPNSERRYVETAVYIRACEPFGWRFSSSRERVERPDAGISVIAWRENPEPFTEPLTDNSDQD